MTTKNMTVGSVMAVVAEEVESWLHSHSDESVRKTVRKMLDNKLQQVIYKVLGMENDWGRGWRVDHCNGRMSDVRELIENNARKEVSTVLSEFLMKKVHTKAFLKPMEKALAREYEEVFRRDLLRMAREKASKDARQLLDDHLEEIITGIVNESPELAEAMSRIHGMEHLRKMGNG